jgi:NAD-dependent dihydropyrimidine dehydrogenase PreA subunit
MGFSFTVVASICEGLGDCIPACPVECIYWADGRTNDKGTRFVYIDGSECINCHACLSVCPIEGAILSEWKPDLQTIDDPDQAYRKFHSAWRTPPVRAAAERMRQEATREHAVALADALASAGCQDLRLLHHLRSDPLAEVLWVADHVLLPPA